ncbi:MAG: NYN domain-containing protein [Candidatus Methanoperedens sp.]|nr:NYN domain-containing protein [Candidatus Methanoperedens sp.]
MAKTALLIDGKYFESVKRNFGVGRIDLELLSDNIIKEFNIDAERYRTYYYDALPWVGDPPIQEDLDRRAKKQSYLDKLKLLKRFEVRYGRVQRIPARCDNCGSEHIDFNQKLVDVLFSIDLIYLAWKKSVDSIAILTGDSDFSPAVRVSKEAGAMIYLVYDPTTYVHEELKLACDDRLILNKELFDSVIL